MWTQNSANYHLLFLFIHNELFSNMKNMISSCLQGNVQVHECRKQPLLHVGVEYYVGANTAGV